MTSRLEQQISFLVEIDKVKQIFRRTRLFDHSRYENDAEHAWHLAMMAIVLAEHANEPGLDVAKVVKMVLLHDLVEIDTGDLFLYDAAEQARKVEAEPLAARRIFGLLPEDQREAFLALWEEFEARQTPEAKFAAALDRMAPILQNHRDEGHSWQKHGVTADRVHAAVKHIGEGSSALWDYTQALLEDAIKQGWLRR